MDACRRLVHLTILVILLPTATASGLGAGPATVIFKNMMVGQNWHDTITVNANTNESLQTTISIEGFEEGWITFQPQNYNMTAEDEFILIPGKPLKVRVQLTLPDDVLEGVYEGKIAIKSKPVSSEATGLAVPVGIGVNLKVIIFVTNKARVSLKDHGLRVYDSLVGLPIVIEYALENTGNVNITPTFRYDIIDVNKKMNRHFWETYHIIQQNQEIQDFVDIIPVDDFPIGNYILNIRVYDTDQTLLEKSSNFKVLPKGTKLDYDITKFITTTTIEHPREKTEITGNAIIIIVSGLIIFSILIAIGRKKKKK